MGQERVTGHSFERKRDSGKEKEWQKEQEKIKKQSLEKIREIERLFQKPEILHARRGIEGMNAAQEILKAQNAVGLLIGGLSRAVYNKGATIDDLELHKDVDVMVLNDSFSLRGNFYGGIDWWFPQKNGAASFCHVPKWGTVWKNGNDIRLLFTLERMLGYSDKYDHNLSYSEFSGLKEGDNANSVFKNSEEIQEFFSNNEIDILPSGLYIPTREWILKKSAREFRQMYRKKYKADPSYLESNLHKEEIESTLGESVMESLTESFNGYVLSEDQHSHAPYFFDRVSYADVGIPIGDL